MKTLHEQYEKEVIPALRKEFGYKNAMAVPKIEKVVVNIGVGRFREDKQREEIQKYIAMITGQKANARPAKQAIASFKTREGMVVGYRVTLRGARMYDFLTRLIRIALPRMRDFKGIPTTAMDHSGNLTLGLKEHTIFPELIGEDYHFLFGLEVTIVTLARRREEGVALLKLMGFPLQTEGAS